MLVTVLVGVCQEGLLAVCLLDVRLGAGLAHGFYAEDVVELCGFAPADAQDCRLLLGCVLALLVALGVFSVAGRGRVVGGIRPGGGCAGRHDVEAAGVSASEQQEVVGVAVAIAGVQRVVLMSCRRGRETVGMGEVMRLRLAVVGSTRLGG